ncbi:MAG: polyprenyl synthetase family protein [bacterium]|nr:polyprenyl synthetase family protein [bacterium]
MSARTQHVDFEKKFDATRTRVNQRLSELLDLYLGGPPRIQDAVRYVLLDGGKRLRPILCVWTHDLLDGTNDDACLDVAVAIECLHTYTLVHDDLPCMDDDDLRRGKPSCHKQFGEAIAVLTGDAVQSLCFEIVSDIERRIGLTPRHAAAVTRIIARAAGTRGLIAGQTLDLYPEGKRDLSAVSRVHRAKTAELIAAAMESGAVIADPVDDVRGRVRLAGLSAGEAFQIIDDVLDVEAEVDTLGKTPRKDLSSGKLTYPSVAGADASRARAAELVSRAKTQLEGLGDTSALEAILDFLIVRKR